MRRGPNLQNIPIRIPEGTRIRDAFLRRDRVFPREPYKGEPLLDLFAEMAGLKFPPVGGEGK